MPQFIKIQYQIKTEPVFTPPPEVITTNWFGPLSEPIRVKQGLAARFQQFIAYQPFPFTPSTGWFQPLSEPSVKIKKPVAQQQFLAWGDTTPETVTVDKWFAPWREPVRVKPGLRPHLQQSFTTSPRPFVPFDWFGPFSEPAVKAKKAVAQQHFLSWGYVAPEVITVDKWYSPLADPIQKTKKPVVQQQVLAWGYTTPSSETVTVDKWYAAWRDPIRVKVGLSTRAQQFLAFQYPPVVTEVLFSYSETAVPYSSYLIYQSRAEPVSTPVIAAEYAPPANESVNITYENRFQYQNKAEPVFVPPAVTTAWFSPLSEPVRIKRAVVQQLDLGWGYTTPETVTVDKWHAPWRDPVRVRAGLLPSLQHAWTGSPQPFVPFGWFAPLSEPVRIKKSVAQQQYLAWGYTTPEVVTVDKWFAPWREPVRIKAGLGAGAQQFLAHAPFEEQRTLDKWFSPWHEPVRVKAALAPSLQQPVAWIPFTEFVTVDKWFAPWHGPVRVKLGLAPSTQQFIAQVPFQANIDWYAPLSEPSVKAKRPVAPNQFLAWGYSTPETVTVDKWFASWREPVRVKRGLLSNLHQAWTGNPQPFVPFSWFAGLSEPSVKAKRAVAQQQNLAWGYSTPETVTVDKWYAPWREPVRVKAGLRTSQYPFFTTSTQPFVSFSWYEPLSEPSVRTKRGVVQYPFLAQVPFTAEVVTVDKWFAPWREPIRVKIGLKTSAHPFIAHTPFVEVSRPDKWYEPWRDPVRVKPGLRAAAQPYLAFVQFTEQTAQESKWHQPWSEPVRVKPGLKPGLQQFLAAPATVVASNITLILNATEIGDGFSGQISVIYCFHSHVSVVEIAVPHEAVVATEGPATVLASVSIIEGIVPNEAVVATQGPPLEMPVAIIEEPDDLCAFQNNAFQNNAFQMCLFGDILVEVSIIETC